MHAKFEALFNAGDLEGLVALYEPDAILNPSPDRTARGTAAIRATMQEFLALGGKIRIITTAVFEGSGIALTHGDWALTGGNVELAGKTAEVLRQQPDGQWLYVIDNPWA
jgi:ketosteroid isomerase-like protein